MQELSQEVDDEMEVDGDDTDEPETTDDTEEDDDMNNDDDETGDDDGSDMDTEDDMGDDTEESNEEQVSVNNKTLFYFDLFEELFHISSALEEKVRTLSEFITEQNGKELVNSIEQTIQKQKNDITFLLQKKIMYIEEENLKELYKIMKTRTETLSDVVSKINTSDNNS
jgi:hypothetical protein